MSDRKFLNKILSLSSPTGAEQNLQRYIAEWAKPFADEIEADLLGNMSITINSGAKIRVMLAAHCDQIGFIVMGITKQGYLRVDPLGGIDEATAVGSKVIIRTSNGIIKGVFGKISTHLESAKAKEEVSGIDELWIDIGAKDKEEAAKMVSIGDYVVYESDVIDLAGGRIAAPALDNMLGLYVIMQTTKRCAARKINVSLYCVSTIQEEIGSRGAQTAGNTIKPYIAIAVDTTLAIDTPGKPKSRTAPRIALGAGPSILQGPNGNPGITMMLKKAAKKAGVEYQSEIVNKKAGNDAGLLQIADGGTAAGSVGIPLRNMHTQVEVADLKDVEDSVKLLTEFICSIKPDLNLLPINMDSRGRDIGQIISKIGIGIDAKEEYM